MHLLTTCESLYVLRSDFISFCLDIKDRFVLKHTVVHVHLLIDIWAGTSFLGALAKLRKSTVRFVMSVHTSVCPHRYNSAPTGRNFVKFYI
jgi:hypothetical protein